MRATCVFLVLACVLSSCGHVMSPAGLATADRQLQYAELIRNPEALIGKRVLLGGVIVDTQSSGDVTRLEVAQFELFNNGVPDDSSPSGGRFLAISGQLIDPAIYRRGLLVTIIGEIKGKRVQKLDGADYPYPLISIKEMRLFRASEPAAAYPGNPYQNQFGDQKLLRRPPPGLLDGETRKPL